MKKLLSIFILCMFGFQSQSQVLITLLLGDKLNSDGLEFGLEGGVNWSDVSALENDARHRLWNLGFYFDIRLKNHWFLYTGTLVKAGFGAQKLSTSDLNLLQAQIYTDLDDPTMEWEGDYSQEISYFMVPVLVKYKFKNHIYLEAGPQFGLMYNAWIQFDTEVDGLEGELRQNNEDQINRIDAGLMAGTGIRLFRGTGWTLGAKYYYGLVDVYKDISDTKNSSLFLKVNIPVGAGKRSDRKSPSYNADEKGQME